MILLASIAFANESWGWVAMLSGAVAFLVLALTYWRSPLRGGAKVAAVTLKGLGLALLALALMEPVHREETPKRHANEVAILVDNSAGLAVPLGEGSPAPSESLRSLLLGETPEQSPSWIGAIGDVFRIQTFLFDRGLRQVSDFGDLDFSRHSSALGAAMENLSFRFRNRPLAAIVLFTDGNATDRGALEDYLAALESHPPKQRLPIFPVVVGELDPLARDLAILRVDPVTSPFEDAPVTLNVEVAALGEFTEPLEIFVLNERGEEIGKKDFTVPLGKGRRQTTVRLRLGGVASGVSFLTVALRQGSGEPLPQLTEGNDRWQVAVDRGAGPYRVLYIAGRPNWEYKFLRRAIAGDAELDLVGLLRIAKREPKFEWRGHTGESSNPLFRGFNRDIPEEAQRYDEPVLIRLNTASAEELRGGFPKAAEELFPQYRAIIIDDLEAEFFTQEQQELIERFVSMRGGTVIMLGGQESYQQGGWNNTPVGRLLPVYLDAPSAGEPALEGVYQLTREGWLEEWMRHRVGQEEEEIRLAYMPPFFAINRLSAIKPGASVLSTVTDREKRVHPALVVHRYGSGRAAAVSIADFWRWGLKDAEQQAELGRMWRQLLRWAVTDVPARMELEKQDSSAGGSPVTRLSVRVRDLEFNPQDEATVTLEVKDLQGGSRRLLVEPSLDEPGLFTAEYFPEESLSYRIEAKAYEGSGEEIGSRVAGSAFNPAADELARLGPDTALLSRLAAASGGRLLQPGELDRLPGWIEALDHPVAEVKLRPLWHAPWFFLLALACFLGEWALRRKRGTI